MNKTYHIIETLENGQTRLALAVLIRSKAIKLLNQLRRLHLNRSYKIMIKGA